MTKREGQPALIDHSFALISCVSSGVERRLCVHESALERLPVACDEAGQKRWISVCEQDLDMSGAYEWHFAGWLVIDDNDDSP